MKLTKDMCYFVGDDNEAHRTSAKMVVDCLLLINTRVSSIKIFSDYLRFIYMMNKYALPILAAMLIAFGSYAQKPFELGLNISVQWARVTTLPKQL